MRSAMLMHNYTQKPTATNTLLFSYLKAELLKSASLFLSYLQWKTQVQKMYHRIEGLRISLAYNSPLALSASSVKCDLRCTILVSDMP